MSIREGVKAPMDIECPACRARPGDLCRQILVDGTAHPTESVDFHHASRVDAAFRSLTDSDDTPPRAKGVATTASPVRCAACQRNRVTIAQLTALLAEAYARIDERPTAGSADWLLRAKEALGR
jgi:hypothetical protein